MASKFLKRFQMYLVVALPFVVLTMAWSSLQPEAQIAAGPRSFHLLWEVLSYNLIIWFAALIVFLVTLAVSKTVREQTLLRIANIREQDEREEVITGRASRSSYVSTLSVLILLLFLSVFTLQIKREPESQAINGKRGTISIGLKFNLLNEPAIERNEEGKVLFESRDIPLSKTGILLLILAWQLVSFNVSARREFANSN